MEPTGTRSTAPPRTPAASGAGAVLFARYAYAPNEQGYCGPGDHRALLEYGANRVSDPGLTAIARAFEGAWPYLTLIAAGTGIPDPLDARVVEAYWVGNGLLDQIDLTTFGRSLEDRFRARTGPVWDRLAETIPAGGLPHHSFHVFCVYPWTGLLDNPGLGGEPLRILDRCRIRWGQVEAVHGHEVVVRCQPLQWDGTKLWLDAPHAERVTAAVDGLGFVTDLQPGEWVSLHWEWVCDRLTPHQLHQLRTYTSRILDLTNRRLAHPGTAEVLG